MIVIVILESITNVGYLIFALLTHRRIWSTENTKVDTHKYFQLYTEANFFKFDYIGFHLIHQHNAQWADRVHWYSLIGHPAYTKKYTLNSSIHFNRTFGIYLKVAMHEKQNISSCISSYHCLQVEQVAYHTIPFTRWRLCMQAK